MLNMSRVLLKLLFSRNGPGLACGSATPAGCRKKDGGQARFLDQGFGLFKMRVRPGRRRRRRVRDERMRGGNQLGGAACLSGWQCEKLRRGRGACFRQGEAGKVV